MGERLAGGNVAIALLANALATGAALVALIVTFGPVSGAHFNPLVTLIAFSGARRGTAARSRPCRRAVRRRRGRRAAGARDVRGAARRLVHARSQRSLRRSSARRSRRSGCRRDRVGLAAHAGGGAVCRRRLHRGRLLVHGLHVVCQPGGDAGAGVDRHVRRHPPGGRTLVLVGQAVGAGAAAAVFGWLVPDIARSRKDRLMDTVIFACVHNAGRSQMAAAWFNALADPAQRARRVGRHAARRPRAPGGRGRDARGRHRPVREPAAAAHRGPRAGATLLVTMGCGDECPFVPGLQTDDWPLPDPKGRPIEEVRADARRDQLAGCGAAAGAALGPKAPAIAHSGYERRSFYSGLTRIHRILQVKSTDRPLHSCHSTLRLLDRWPHRDARRTSGGCSSSANGSSPPRCRA